MKRGIWLAVMVIGIAAVSMQSAAAGHKPVRPIAGPWYTAKELRALIIFSDLSLRQKKALLASVNGSPTWARHHVVIAPSGPWYTRQELRALIAYSKASFKEKQRLLAGGTVPPASPRSVVTGGDAFDWADAGVGGAVVFALGAVAAAVAVLDARRRSEGQNLTP